MKRFEFYQAGYDDRAIDLSCLITSHSYMKVWPLIHDPHQVARFLLKRMFPDIVFINANVR